MRLLDSAACRDSREFDSIIAFHSIAVFIKRERWIAIVAVLPAAIAVQLADVHASTQRYMATAPLHIATSTQISVSIPCGLDAGMPRP